ncbi:MAG TPA: hypothetical protein VG709_04380 [Actinomycetota bacterium]|nr:hypothetical protein [Actinomycetota bacterium]
MTEQNVRDRLTPVLDRLPVDIERALEVVARRATRRTRMARAATIAVAAVVAAVGVVAIWRLSGLRDDAPRPGSVGARGKISYIRVAVEGEQQTVEGFVAAPDGSGRIPLITDSEWELFPAWSPDGRRVAYAGGPSDDVERTNLYLAAPDGTAGRKLVDGGVTGPMAWSPDGTHIAFIRRDPFPGEDALWIVQSDGTGARRVLDGRWNNVAWSPKGNRLALGGDPGGGDVADAEGIYVVGADGQGLRRVTPAEDGFGFFPTWSPDGSRIAFVRNQDYDDIDPKSDIYVVDIDGGAAERLTQWEGLDTIPVWSPDGGELLFTSDRGVSDAERRQNMEAGELSGSSIYALDLETGVTRLVIDGGDAAVFVTSWVD